MYEYGLKLWSINTDYYLFEALKLYESGIFDYIELYVVPDSLKELEAWSIVANNHKIPFVIHAPHFMHGFNLAKAEKKEFNKKVYEEVKTFADTLNAEHIIFHGGIDGNIEETAKQLASFNEPRALIENKPYVAIPNRMNGEFCRGYNIEEIKTVIDEANCGFCLDFGHAICAANSLFEKLAPSYLENAHVVFKSDEMKQNILQGARTKFVYDYCEKFLELNPAMFHLTDINDMNSPFDSHPHIGEGKLDIKRVLKLIPYGKKITVETVKNSKLDLADFEKDMDILKSM